MWQGEEANICTTWHLLTMPMTSRSACVPVAVPVRLVGVHYKLGAVTGVVGLVYIPGTLCLLSHSGQKPAWSILQIQLYSELRLLGSCFLLLDRHCTSPPMISATASSETTAGATCVSQAERAALLDASSLSLASAVRLAFTENQYICS